MKDYYSLGIIILGYVGWGMIILIILKIGA